MSLLHQEELDDAAKGEELTKGTSHVVIAAIVAGLVVSIAIAIYVIAEQKPPFAAGEITAIWAHPQHTETSGIDAAGAPMPKQDVDQVMVFATVSLQNKTDHPLYLGDVTTNVTLAMAPSPTALPPTRATTTASLWLIRIFPCRT